MNVKAFEIRDAGTFIPVVAIQMVPSKTGYAQLYDEAERYLLRRAGFGFEQPAVIVCKMEASGCDRNATYDPYAWGSVARTMSVAHTYIEQHFNELQSGDVVDVEFILKETQQPKVSERNEDPYHQPD